MATTVAPSGVHAPQMPPASQSLGLFPAFFARQPETLVVREKALSLSGDSFEIKTIDGRAIFQVKGEAFSLSGRKRLMDMQGNELFTIRKQHVSIHKTYYAEDPAGNHIFQVQSKMSLLHSKAFCTFSANGKEERLMMKGDFFNTTADITNDSNAMAVAQIDRKLLNANELFFGQQTYAVTVAPNVDMALIVAMCICLDEMRNESKMGA